MPNRTAKTPQKLKKLIAMHKAGESTRTIAKALKVSQPTASRWVKELGMVPNGGSGRPPRDLASNQAEETAVDAAELLVDDAPLEVGSRKAVDARRREVSAMLDELGDAVKGGAYPAAQYASIVKLEGDLAARVVAMTPSPPLDPELDPNNRERAATVRAKLEGLLDRVEPTLKCQHCGKQPWPLKGPTT